MNVFISHKKEDGATAQEIYDELTKRTNMNVKGEEMKDFDINYEVVNAFQKYLKNIRTDLNLDEEKKKITWNKRLYLFKIKKNKPWKLDDNWNDFRFPGRPNIKFLCYKSRN